jgi:hypothetical protein
MSGKYKKLIEQILTLHDLHKRCSSSDIADEIRNSDCLPPQTRHALICDCIFNENKLLNASLANKNIILCVLKQKTVFKVLTHTPPLFIGIKR